MHIYNNGAFIYFLLKLFFTFSFISSANGILFVHKDRSRWTRPPWRMIKAGYIYRSRRVRKIYKGSGRSLGWPGRRVAPSFGTSWEKEGKELERYEGRKVTRGGITCVRILSRYTRSFRTLSGEVNVLSRRSPPCNFSVNLKVRPNPKAVCTIEDEE